MSETLHYAAKKQAENTCPSFQHLAFSLLPLNQLGNVHLYPVQLPEQRIDGVTFQPSTKLPRIEE